MRGKDLLVNQTLPLLWFYRCIIDKLLESKKGLGKPIWVQNGLKPICKFKFYSQRILNRYQSYISSSSCFYASFFIKKEAKIKNRNLNKSLS